MFSITLAFMDSYCSLIAILSISLIIFSTEFKGKVCFLIYQKKHPVIKFDASKSVGSSIIKSPKKNLF